MKKCNKLYILTDENEDLCLASPWESDCFDFIAECEYETLTDFGDLHTRWRLCDNKTNTKWSHEDLAQYGLENGWTITEIDATGIYVPDTMDEFNKGMHK